MPTLAQIQAANDPANPNPYQPVPSVFFPTPFQPVQPVYSFPATTATPPPPGTTAPPPSTTAPPPATPAPVPPPPTTATPPGAGNAAQQDALNEQRNIAAGSVTRTDDATAAALEAQRQAAAKQDALYAAAQATNKPYSELGNLSIAQLQDMINNPAKFDATAVQNEPGYQFAIDQGQKAVTRTAQATGTLGNGGQYARATRLAVDIASQKYNEAFNRLMAVQQQRQDLLKSGATIGENANAATQNAGLALGTQLQQNTDAQSNVITGGAQQNNATMGQLSSQISNLDIATLDATTRAKLAQMGIDSNEKMAAAGITSQQQIAQMGITSQWNLANLDSNTRLKLGQMGIDSDAKLAQMGITNQQQLAQWQNQSNWNIANLDATTRTNLAQMGIDSNEKLASLDAALRTKLTQMGIDSNLALGQLDATTRLNVAGIQSKAGNAGLVAVTGILSSLAGNPAFVKDAIGAVKKGIDGGTDTSPGGAGKSIANFLKDPLTIGIGAAIAVGVSILKSQAHWEANTYVKDFQNPYFETFAKPAHDAFFDAASKGALTKESAQAALSDMETAWAEFQSKSNDWAGSSSDKKTVTGNAYGNKSGTFYTTNENIIKNMQSVVDAMGAA